MFSSLFAVLLLPSPSSPSSSSSFSWFDQTVFPTRPSSDSSSTARPRGVRVATSLDFDLSLKSDEEDDDDDDDDKGFDEEDTLLLLS